MLELFLLADAAVGRTHEVHLRRVAVLQSAHVYVVGVRLLRG